MGVKINDRAYKDDYENFYSLIFSFHEYFVHDDQLKSRWVTYEVTAEIDDDGVLANYNLYITKDDNNSSNESSYSFSLRRRNILENLLGITSSIGLINLIFYSFFAIVIIYNVIDSFVKKRAKKETISQESKEE